MIKQSAVVEMIISRYNEMKVNNFLPLVKEINELVMYFPDYEQKQIPDRKLMYSIIGTLRYDELKSMIVGARKNRALKEEKSTDDFVYIQNELYKEIYDVMVHKSKLNIYRTSIASNGKTAFLVKKSSKLTKKESSHRNMNSSLKT